MFIITRAQKSITPKISGSTGGEIRGRYHKEPGRWRARYKKPFIPGREREREREPACRPPTTILLSGQRKKDEENFNKSRRALNYSSPGRRRSSAHAERPIVSPRRLFTRPRVVRGLTFF